MKQNILIKTQMSDFDSTDGSTTFDNLYVEFRDLKLWSKRSKTVLMPMKQFESRWLETDSDISNHICKSTVAPAFARNKKN